MRPAGHPLDVLDVDGDGRGVPQLELGDEAAHRTRWQELNAIDLPTITAPSTRD